jgi:hypothetical protein
MTATKRPRPSPDKELIHVGGRPGEMMISALHVDPIVTKILLLLVGLREGCRLLVRQ